MAFNLMDPNVQQTVVNPVPSLIGFQPPQATTNSFSGGGTVTQQSGGGSSQSSSQQSSQSGSYFSNPALVDSMARQFAGLYENVVPTYNEFMQDPVNSNTFQTQLKSLLASLAPGEADARSALTDRFRASGGLRSGMHGVAGARLEGDIIGRRQNAAGTLLGQTIQQMTQLLGLPMSQMAPLIQALELQQASSQGSSVGSSFQNPTSRTSSSGTGGSLGGGGTRPASGTPPGGRGSTPTGGGGGDDLVWLDDWVGGGWYPRNTPYEDRFYPADSGGGGGGGGGSSGDDWNDYYNRPLTDEDYNNYYNLNTEIEVPGMGISTGDGSGDDWNDFYNNTTYLGDEGF